MDILIILCIFVQSDDTLLRFQNMIKSWDNNNIDKSGNYKYIIVVSGYVSPEYINSVNVYLNQNIVHTILFPTNAGKSEYINSAVDWYICTKQCHDTPILTIDSDIQIKNVSQFITHMISACLVLPKCGILAPLQLGDNRHLNTIYQYHEIYKLYNSDDLINVYWSDLHPSVAGGCIMFWYSTYINAGKFQNVGMYGPEDVLFAENVHKLGLRCYVCTNINVYHPPSLLII